MAKLTAFVCRVRQDDNTGVRLLVERNTGLKPCQKATVAQGVGEDADGERYVTTEGGRFYKIVTK